MITTKLRPLVCYEYFVDNEDPMKRYCTVLPGYNLFEAETLIFVLNDIELSHARILSDDTLFEPSPFPDHKNHRCPTWGCSLKQTWHVASYIIYTCQINGMLKKMYSHYLDFVNKHCSVSLPNRKLEPGKHIELLEKYRNKVFAHAAYYDPRKEDTEEQKRDSLSIMAATRGWSLPNGSRLITFTGHETLHLAKCAELASKMLDAWVDCFIDITRFIDTKTLAELSTLFNADVRKIKNQV